MECYSNPMKNIYRMTKRIETERTVDWKEVADVLRQKAKITYRQGYHRQGKEDELVKEIYEKSQNITNKDL